MSINVTVTGNPVNIKRGRMVTCDPNQTKKEFEKRRLMRLEQVRQQSKEIAEKVRNKVRKEKNRQISEIEKEGKQKLKNWQNKKLIELQTQYEEVLQELGSGHKEATEVGDEAEMLAEQRDYNDKVATHRGQVAATKLQIEKNKENLKKAIPIQTKKMIRDIENTRASLVSSVGKGKCADTCGKSKGKRKPKRKPVADINITVVSSDTESSGDGLHEVENRIHGPLPKVDEEEEPSTSSCGCTSSSEHPRQPLSPRMRETDLHLNLHNGK